MQPFDLSGLRTYDLHTRPSKVRLSDLGRPADPATPVGDWLDALPKQLAATELRKVRDHLVRARRDGRHVVAAIGGHVVKTGCGPYLIDLINHGVITAVAMNGAAAIHDFELGYAGQTSEDVGAVLHAGEFGMARQTADAVAVAAEIGATSGRGLGHGLGAYMDRLGCPHGEVSVVLAAYRAGIPCTVHVAIGTDIVHMHPQVSGAALGQASLLDFRVLCTAVSELAHGVWLNLGSAVVMPEVFLKAVSVVKNFGHPLDGLIAVNFDKESKYRTVMNVLRRPAAEGIEVIGHHELLIPLLHAVVSRELSAMGREPDQKPTLRPAA